MKNVSFKALLPHLIAISVFFLITLMFFHPVIIDGKVMTQNDIVQGISSGQEIKNFRLETGEEALWTNSMFGGMPAYLINIYWSGDLTVHIHNLLSLYLPSPARYTLLGMLCFYILLLAFRVNPYVAIAGGIAFGINSFTMVSIEAGHIWKVSAITYMPLVLAGVQLIMRKKTLLGIGVTSAAVALLVRSNHIQIAYYLFFVLLVFWIVHLITAIKGKELPAFAKTTAFIAIAGILGIGANLGKLWTAAEYSPYTIRGKSELTSNTQSTSGGLDRDYAFNWSNGISETLTFLVPYFNGGASAENVGTKSKFAKELRKAGANQNQIAQFAERLPTYWGDQPYTAGPIYPGVIVVFLFVLGIFTVKGPVRNWLIAATIVGFALSWGKNFSSFNYLMFDYFPLYNKFRAVSMALIIPILCIPILGFLGLSEFLKNPDKKVLIKSTGIVGGLLLLLLIASPFLGYSGQSDASMQQVVLDAIISQRKSMFQSSAFRSLVLIAITSGLLYFFDQKKLGLTAFAGVLSFVIFIDLYTVDKNYFNKDKFSKKDRIASYQADQADQKINTDATQYRVLNLTVDVFSNATTSYHHSSIGGYHGAKLRRYNDLIQYHIGNEIQSAVGQIQSGTYDLANTPVLNMLNTKYLKLGSAENAVLQNNNSMGNAWFVSDIRSVATPDAAILSIGSEDLRSVAVSEKLESKSGFSGGSIELIDYKPNHLTYAASNQGDGFAVFSEVYYEKGWKAFIDEQPVEIHQVDYVLRGLEVPSGAHTIEFKFEPKSYYAGNTIMLFGSIVVIGLLLFSIGSEIKQQYA